MHSILSTWATNWISGWRQVFRHLRVQTPVTDLAIEYALMATSVAVASAGIALAYLFYIRRPELPQRLYQRAQPVHKVLTNKFYVDEIYEAILIKPLHRISDLLLFRVIDRAIIDALVHGVGRFFVVTADSVRTWQTGSVATYALTLVVATVLMLLYYLGF